MTRRSALAWLLAIILVGAVSAWYGIVRALAKGVGHQTAEDASR